MFFLFKLLLLSYGRFRKINSNIFRESTSVMNQSKEICSVYLSIHIDVLLKCNYVCLCLWVWNFLKNDWNCLFVLKLYSMEFLREVVHGLQFLLDYVSFGNILFWCRNNPFGILNRWSIQLMSPQSQLKERAKKKWKRHSHQMKIDSFVSIFIFNICFWADSDICLDSVKNVCFHFQRKLTISVKHSIIFTYPSK